MSTCGAGSICEGPDPGQRDRKTATPGVPPRNPGGPGPSHPAHPGLCCQSLQDRPSETVQAHQLDGNTCRPPGPSRHPLLRGGPLPLPHQATSGFRPSCWQEGQLLTPSPATTATLSPACGAFPKASLPSSTAPGGTSPKGPWKPPVRSAARGAPGAQRPGQVRGRWSREVPRTITYPYWDTRVTVRPHTPLGTPSHPRALFHAAHMLYRTRTIPATVGGRQTGHLGSQRICPGSWPTPSGGTCHDKK